VCAIHKSSCCSRCFRVPIDMRRFYKQTLCIPQNLLLTNQDLHHGLLGQKLKNEYVIGDLDAHLFCLIPRLNWGAAF